MEYKYIEQENRFWNQTKQQFEQETDLEHFKTWPVVRSVPIYNEDAIHNEYSTEVSEMIARLDLGEQQRWCSVLKEPFKGHTTESYQKAVRTILNGVECSGWTQKTAHHLLTYESMSGKSINSYDQIVEFGAGIGETARMIRDLGFRGEYYIYDLPEVSRISSYYLDGWVKSVDHYKQIPITGKTLFIGTWSLSEVPFEYRNEIAAHFKGQDFLIIFQNSVFEYSNQPYFLFTFPYVSNTFYRLQPISWNSGGNGNFYMIAQGC